MGLEGVLRVGKALSNPSVSGMCGSIRGRSERKRETECFCQCLVQTDLDHAMWEAVATRPKHCKRSILPINQYFPLGLSTINDLFFLSINQSILSTRPKYCKRSILPINQSVNQYFPLGRNTVNDLFFLSINQSIFSSRPKHCKRSILPISQSIFYLMFVHIEVYIRPFFYFYSSLFLYI